MNVVSVSLQGVYEITPKKFEDHRGWFLESFNLRDFSAVIGEDLNFVQDNHSYSRKGVLRGMHYQTENTQGKLVRVVSGEVYDVVVDLRLSSKTYGKSYGTFLSGENMKQLWVPPGMAHGFLVLSPDAHFLYKTTDYYNSYAERCIAWDDPDLNISWPLRNNEIHVSSKDRQGVTFRVAEKFA